MYVTFYYPVHGASGPSGTLEGKLTDSHAVGPWFAIFTQLFFPLHFSDVHILSHELGLKHSKCVYYYTAKCVAVRECMYTFLTEAKQYIYTAFCNLLFKWFLNTITTTTYYTVTFVIYTLCLSF